MTWSRKYTSGAIGYDDGDGSDIDTTFGIYTKAYALPNRKRAVSSRSLSRAA
jgi:hypothetical protein